MVEEDLIYDIGLHKGEDAAFYLRKGYRVLGFEADPGLVDYCRRRFASETQTGRLGIEEGAIAPPDYGESVTFYRNSNVSLWGTVCGDWVQRNESLGASSYPIHVPRIDLQGTIRRQGVPYYMKIDIEGMDRYVLDTIVQLNVKPALVSIESEKVDFQRFIDDLHRLESAGYGSFKLVQQQWIGGSSIATVTLDGTPMEHVFEDNASGPFGDEAPGPWIPLPEVVRRYRKVFAEYRLFGDRSPLRRLPRGGTVISGTGRYLLRRPLPGWYDIHAALGQERT